MMVAVILGALSLGACVDNNESASVEAVRNAKAAQLNSVAAMNNAEAEAQKAITAAEVALKEAEAAYKKAQAEAAQADAEQQKILLQIAQAGLEAQLEVNKIKAEAALAKAKANLEGAKADLIASMDKVDAATKKRITDLLAKADPLLVNINNYRTQLVTAKNDLAKLKAGLITADLVRQKTIADQEKNKANAQALITEYEKYSLEDKANAEAAAKAAKANALALEKIADDKEAASTAARNAYSTASINVGGSRFVRVLQNNGYYTTENVDGKLVYYTNEDATTGSVYQSGYTKYVANIDAINAEIKNETRNLSVAKAALTDATKALTEAKATDTYKAYEKAVTDAQKKFDEAKTESEKNAAKQELMGAEYTRDSYIKSYDDAVKDATTRIETLDKSLVRLNEVLTVATGDDAAAYATLLDALVKSIDSLVEADIAESKASHNFNIQNTLANSLSLIANGLTDYATLIFNEKKNIANADELIADASTIVTKEQAILNKEKEIAALENNLAVSEPIYNDYLAQIKALVDVAE